MSAPYTCSSQVTAEQHTLAKYLLELTMVDYDMVHFPPSMVASAALAFTLKILDAGEWVSLTSDKVLSLRASLPNVHTITSFQVPKSLFVCSECTLLQNSSVPQLVLFTFVLIPLQTLACLLSSVNFFIHTCLNVEHEG